MDIEKLINIDKTLLPIFNGSGSMFVDRLAITLTSGYTWIPLYVVLLYLVMKNNEKWNSILLIIMCSALCILFSGGVSDLFIKDYFARLRPINDPALRDVVKVILGYKVQGYSFFSSHAANTMSLSVFFMLLVRSRNLSLFLLVWSLLNGWTRLYLGVHYPLDVFVGFVWGAIAGIIVYSIFLFIYKKINYKLHYVSSQYTKTGYDITDIDVVLNVFMLIFAYVVIRTVITAF